MAARSLGDFHKLLSVSKRGEIVGREEYLDAMTFVRPGRPMFTEIFGPMVGLKEEWTAQGATPAELDLSSFRYRYAVDGTLPVRTGFIHGQPEVILEETDDHIIARDSLGRRVKLAKHAASLPLPLEHPVANMDDWQRLKPHYQFSEDRLPADWQAVARQHLADSKVLTVSIPGGFDEPRRLMGEEMLCLAYFDQPELIADMLDTIGQTACQVLDRVSSQVQVDKLFVHEDMAGRSGPLLGPNHVRQFILPYYRRVWDMLSSRGARLFSQDSDGFIEPLIPVFLEAGVNMMYPLEPAAGMDAVAVRRKYGTKLAMMGGIDKFALLRGHDAIIAELEYKIPPLIQTGGAVLGLDHRIPNGVTIENYRFYTRKAWEIIEASL